MKQFLVLLFAVATLSSCKKHPSEVLNGTWSNKAAGYTMTINTVQKTYKGTSNGVSFDGNFDVVSENDKQVVLATKGMKFITDIKSDKDIVLTNEKEKKPLPLHKTE